MSECTFDLSFSKKRKCAFALSIDIYIERFFVIYKLFFIKLLKKKSIKCR